MKDKRQGIRKKKEKLALAFLSATFLGLVATTILNDTRPLLPQDIWHKQNHILD